jgi:hypothetical protein
MISQRPLIAANAKGRSTMSQTNKIFAYCERGLDPGFWAEPLNALSNVAFLVAAAAALRQWRALPDRQARRGSVVLIGLVMVIGIGSFLFHTMATPWAALADVIPITLFMIAYLGYALRRFAGLSWPLLLGLVAGFIGSLVGAGMIKCGGKACFNGSLGYLPALLALWLIGAVLWVRRHPAAKSLLLGGGIFLLSLGLRTLDQAACPATALFGGVALGTHFLWHIANAILLFVLLSTALRHQSNQP